MTKLRKTFAALLTVATLGAGVLETSSAEAHIWRGGGGFHHGFGRVGHWGGHFGEGHRWGYGYGHGWGYGHHWCFRGGWCRPGTHPGPGFGHRWAYSWGGYRPSVAVGVVPVAAITPACPAGTHLGYRGKYCWPNR